MTLMQLIKLVLDEAYAEIPGTEVAKDAEISAALSQLAPAYADLTNPHRKPIDYASPQARFAYIYKYTVAHADYIRQLIERNDQLRALFQSDSVSVACVGGGPGSDLLGILKYMLRVESKATLTCYLFDRERAWGDSWSEVAKHLAADFQLYPVFQQMDITDASQWASYRKFLTADLFTFSYFLSEVWSFKDQAAPFFEHCMKKAKPGSLFLFIDNNDQHGEFAGWFDTMAAANDIKLLASNCYDMAFAIDEEKKDLEPYFSKFDWPKRKSNVAYRIGKKQ
jgi:SAM-dependent methyltransferase